MDSDRTNRLLLVMPLGYLNLTVSGSFYERQNKYAQIVSFQNISENKFEIQISFTWCHGPPSLWLIDKGCCTQVINTFIACGKNKNKKLLNILSCFL